MLNDRAKIHTLHNPLSPTFASPIELVESVDRGQNLDSADSIQQMSVMPRRRAKPTDVWMETFADKVEYFGRRQSIGVFE